MAVYIRGKKAFETNLNKEIAKLKRVSRKGILKAGLYVQGEAQKQVPRAQGTLAASSFIASDLATKGGTVYVGYHAIYAAAVHENPMSGKTMGMSPSGYPYKAGTWAKTGNWKYLENPIKENIPQILRIIKMAVKRGWWDIF